MGISAFPVVCWQCPLLLKQCPQTRPLSPGLLSIRQALAQLLPPLSPPGGWSSNLKSTYTQDLACSLVKCSIQPIGKVSKWGRTRKVDIQGVFLKTVLAHCTEKACIPTRLLKASQNKERKGYQEKERESDRES